MKIFVATPCFGGMVHAEYMTSVLQTVAETGLVGDFRLLPSDSLVPRARNLLASQFLNSTCDKLLFIDSDIIFRPIDVQRISEHDCDFVGGLYAYKMPGPVRFCMNGFPDRPLEIGDGPLVQVQYVGTGFLCLTRRVFEQIANAWPENSFLPDENADTGSRYDWFKVGVFGNRYLSEDWYFCDRWNALGEKVFVDKRVSVLHIGRIAYPYSGQTQSAPGGEGPSQSVGNTQGAA